MKAFKQHEICIPAMHEELRRVISTDKPAPAVLAWEDPRIRRVIEGVYEEILRERDQAAVVWRDVRPPSRH